MISSFSKESQLSRSPGNRKKQTAPQKGAELEKQIVKTFGGKAKRNHQGKPGGGLGGNSDVTAMPDWCIESKNCAVFSMPAWHRQLDEDTPTNKKKGLVYIWNGEPWLSIPLKDIDAFAFDRIEQLSGEVCF